jgi:hypothetical protein
MELRLGLSATTGNAIVCTSSNGSNPVLYQHAYEEVSCLGLAASEDSDAPTLFGLRAKWSAFNELYAGSLYCMPVQCTVCRFAWTAMMNTALVPQVMALWSNYASISDAKPLCAALPCEH